MVRGVFELRDWLVAVRRKKRRPRIGACNHKKNEQEQDLFVLFVVIAVKRGEDYIDITVPMKTGRFVALSIIA